MWVGFLRNISCFIGFIALVCFAALADDDPSRISNDKPAGYRTYPLISIPLQPGQALQYFKMVLEPNSDPTVIAECKKSQLAMGMPGGGTLDVSKIPATKKAFRVIQVEVGSTLHINTYLVSQNILDSQSGFQKGHDAPTMAEIRAAFNGGDSDVFFRILTKIAEERRSAESSAEMTQVKALNDPNNDPCTQILFGSGFFEVSGENLKSGDKNIRYFVRSSEVLGGKAKLDLKAAKLDVLRGVSVFLFKKIDDDFQDVGNAKQNQLRQKIARLFSEMNAQCSSSSCQLSDSAKIGDIATDTIAILKTEFSDLLEPSLENRLILRKEMCLLKRTMDQCGTSSALQTLNVLIKAERIDCNRIGSLLVQLR